MCGSRKYPYPPPPYGRGLPYDPPPQPSGNLASYIALNFKTPPPPPPLLPEFPIPSVWGSMDIFWNHTMLKKTIYKEEHLKLDILSRN